MGLVEVFQNIRNIPQLMGRVEYTEKFLKNKTMSNQQAVLATVLFSSFIEHISLFSQFLTINEFNKYCKYIEALVAFHKYYSAVSSRDKKDNNKVNRLNSTGGGR